MPPNSASGLLRCSGASNAPSPAPTPAQTTRQSAPRANPAARATLISSLATHALSLSAEAKENVNTPPLFSPFCVVAAAKGPSGVGFLFLSPALACYAWLPMKAHGHIESIRTTQQQAKQTHSTRTARWYTILEQLHGEVGPRQLPSKKAASRCTAAFGFCLSIPNPLWTTSAHKATWPQAGDQWLGGVKVWVWASQGRFHCPLWLSPPFDTPEGAWPLGQST